MSRLRRQCSRRRRGAQAPACQPQSWASSERGDDLAGLRQFRADYPVAKAFLLHAGSERRHDDGVEIVPLGQALASLDRLLADGQLPR